MPVMKRIKTKYIGVYYIVAGASIEKKETEKIFYIVYRRDGRMIEEKAGRQFKDGMTAARASIIRSERIKGKEPSNKEKREALKAKKEVRTISRLWEEYKETHPIKGIKTDENRFDLHINPVFGNKELKDISPIDVDRLRINLLKKKSPQTVKHVLELLKRISNFAVNKRLCPGIDFKIAMPKVSNVKTEDLSPEQIANLLKATDEDSHPYAGAMMKMALFSGMRRGEMFRLQWNDIDFHKGFIHIKNPKGGQDQDIPLNDETRQILKDLPKGDSAYIFPGRGGRERTDIKKAVNEIKKKARLPEDFRPLHGLRHVYASILASSGEVDMYVLQKLLTQKSPMMTQRYSHLRDGALKKASNLVGKLVNQEIEREEKANHAEGAL